MNKRDNKSNAKIAATSPDIKMKPAKKVGNKANIKLDDATISDSTPGTKVTTGDITKKPKKDKIKKINWNPKYGSKTLSKDGKLQPKKPLTAYCLFNMAKNAQLREEQGLSMMEASTQVSKLWNAMSEADRKPFTDKTEADKQRYTKEFTDLQTKGFFLLPDGRKSSDVRVPREGEPMPKSTLSAYMYYNKEQVPKLREGTALTMIESMKKVSLQWAALTEEQLKPYTTLNTIDRQRYEKQLDEFNTVGFFYLADGTKSHESDLVKKVKPPVEKEKAQAGKRKSSNAPIPEVFKKKSTAGTVLDCSKVKTTKTKAKGGKRDQNDPIVTEIKHKPVDKQQSNSLSKSKNAASQAAKAKKNK